MTAAVAGRRPRIGRVRTRGAFAALASGRRARRGVVRVVHVGGGDRASVAYAVGVGVGSSVVRNRVKRRLRAAVADLSPAAGTYLVSVAPAAAERTYGELRDDLAAALAELGTVA